MIIDMDGLKKINDNYGHHEGDYSIKAIASALKAASGADEICTRAGGDEFVVIAKNYDHIRANDYIRSVRDFISAKTKAENKRYSIGVSFGVHIADPSKESKEDLLDEYQLFSSYLKIADKTMYDEKREHKKAEGNI